MFALKFRLSSQLYKNRMAPAKKIAKEIVEKMPKPRIAVDGNERSSFPVKGNCTKLTDAEKQVIADLEQVSLETIKLDEGLQCILYEQELMFEQSYDKIFDKRKQILEDFKKNSHGDNNIKKFASHFWLNVLKVYFKDCITEIDEQILVHLTDIRTKLYKEPYRFEVQFHFEKNDFFMNTMLTKTYFVAMFSDPSDPLPYYGANIYNCEGCHINWINESEREILNESYESNTFFDFFQPIKFPDVEDPNYEAVKDLLKTDCYVGYYFKERIIPKAILFFTREICDLEFLDFDSDSEEIEESQSQEEEDPSKDPIC